MFEEKEVAGNQYKFRQAFVTINRDYRTFLDEFNIANYS